MIPELENTNRVTIELSNRCNYHGQHLLCPNSTFTDVKILPLKTIESVIMELWGVGWGDEKIFCFHVFNEPGIDPRLYHLIRFVSKHLPGIRPLLVTNGWYMDRGLAEELFDAGLKKMTISIYGREERKRLDKSVGSLPGVRIHIGRLKTTLLNPREKPEHRRCYAPLSDLTIRASGNVGLCCIDYAETCSFGNVKDEPFIDILQREYPRMKKLFDELSRRKRNLPVCFACDRRRRPDFKG